MRKVLLAMGAAVSIAFAAAPFPRDPHRPDRPGRNRRPDRHGWPLSPRPRPGARLARQRLKVTQRTEKFP
jgi:hypothetical protein